MATSSKHSQVTVSIESLVSSFLKKLADNRSISSKMCIFKAPKILWRHSPKAYEPISFSIGPFRHGHEDLQSTQKIKFMYLEGLLRRSKHSQELLEQLRGAVREIQKEALQCYAGPITFRDEDFVQILLLDGCFIIELFRKDAEEVMKEPDDPIFSVSCLLEFLKHDLILLENQIPWLVLERLFNLTILGRRSLIELALNFYRNLFSLDKPYLEPALFANHEIKHILDLLRLSLVLPLGKLNKDTGWQPFPTAKKVKDTGIEFRKFAANSVLDIRFNNGVLKIPRLLVQKTTETIFRNLICFEQYYPHCQPIITSYAMLMNSLIDTATDVEILCDNDVMDNWLSPEDASRFFNELYNTDIYVKTFYYHDVCHQVNSYTNRWLSKWRYFYAHNYFNLPLAIVFQVVVALFLIISLLQTYYTIAAYLR